MTTASSSPLKAAASDQLLPTPMTFLIPCYFKKRSFIGFKFSAVNDKILFVGLFLIIGVKGGCCYVITLIIF
jgi:hypothetical protein